MDDTRRAFLKASILASGAALLPRFALAARSLADPRLLANYETALPGWRVAAGEVAVAVGRSAETLGSRAVAELSGGTMKP